MSLNESFLVLLISAAVLNGTPLLFGTVGEVLSERAGNLNLGVEGMMYMGGAVGLGAAYYYEQAAGAGASGLAAVTLAVLFAFLAGAFGALIYAFLTISLRANQNVTGLALAIFGTGAGQFIGEYMRVKAGGYVAIGNDLKAVFFRLPLSRRPCGSSPWWGPSSSATTSSSTWAWSSPPSWPGSSPGAGRASTCAPWASPPPPPTLPASTSPDASTWPPSSAAASLPSAAWSTS